MRVLGAILGGGRSTRFGSDKALAVLEGITLIERVRRVLAPQVDGVVTCGRELPGLTGIADRPAPGLGPLGGLNAALHFAVAEGYDAVLSVPCDVPDLPPDLRRQLTRDGPAYSDQLPVIGLWPADLAPLLDGHIARDLKRSMRGWAMLAQAEAVTLARPLHNINAPADLARWHG